MGLADGPGHRRGHGHRHEHRPDRQVPVAAHVTGGRPGRADAGRPADPGPRRAGGGGGGPGHRVADTHRGRRPRPRSAWPCSSATRSPGPGPAWAWRCAARKRHSSSGSSWSCCSRSSRTRSCRPRACPAGCRRWRTGTRSARWPPACRHLFGNPDPGRGLNPGLADAASRAGGTPLVRRSPRGLRPPGRPPLPPQVPHLRRGRRGRAPGAQAPGQISDPGRPLPATRNRGPR